MTDVNDDDLTRRLIDEGARLLAEHGVAGLSLRKLATAAGTSTMAVYTRFGDKQRLLSAMYAEGFRRLGDRLHAAAADPDAELLDLGRAYRQHALANPHLYGLMFGPLPVGLELDETQDKDAAATYTPLVDGVRAAIAAGVLAGDAERIALHLWSVAHGMVGLELSGQLPSADDQGADPAALYDEALLLAAGPFVASPPEAGSS